MFNFKHVKFISWLTAKVGRELDHVEMEEAFQHVRYMTNVDPKSPHVDCRIVDDLLKAMADKQKLEAIKAYRDLTGVGLKESKDAIERFFR